MAGLVNNVSGLIALRFFVGILGGTFVPCDVSVREQVEGGGEVTSGSLSPMLDVGIGLAYVPAAQAKAGTELVIDVRGRPRTAEVAKKPLYTKETSS